jgi:tRNA/tmRNA/rRNA uracil-C5-methylase (TrmA/RlmC/RlmD family)
VIPPRETIEQRARQIIGMQHVAHAIADLEKSARQHGATAEFPADLVERMRQEFERDPAIPWEDALTRAIVK